MDHGPEDLAGLRRFALDISRADNDKRSIRGKLERAGWADAFRLELLIAVRCDRLGYYR